MERTKVKGWNRARKFLAMYAGNRVMMKKVHNYYTIAIYPSFPGVGPTLTYFEHWKKTFWEAIPPTKLDQKINNIYKHIFNDYEEFIF